MSQNKIIELITDRTIADVTEAEMLVEKIKANTASADEKSKYLSGLRGAYNATDMNRVEGAVRIITERLAALGYNVPNVAAVVWAITDTSLQSQRNEYLKRVAGVRNAFYIKPTTPDLPQNIEHINYITANAIEQNLFDIAALIENMIAIFSYSGEIYAGDE